MDPVAIVAAALNALNGVLSIINHIKAQTGMTDDQILDAADAETLTNAAQIKQLLAGLPPAS